MSRRIGIYPGTFDPVTNGHMDIITRAIRLVDHLIVAIHASAGKSPLFSLDERVSMLRESIDRAGNGLPDRVEVRPFSGLLVRFAEEAGACCILRGLRAAPDFEYEFQMGGMNARLNPEIETIFLMASERQQFIASRLVREVARLGGCIDDFVPAAAARRLARRPRPQNPET